MHIHCLLEKRGDLRQHFIHDLSRQRAHLAGMAGGQVEHARLIAAYDAGGLDALQRYGEAQAASKLAAAGDRENNRQLGSLVEFGRRHDQDGAAAALLLSLIHI